MNVSWYLNGTLVQSNNSVTGAAYTNTSAKQGIWIVNATATNVNGSVSKEWTWIVNAPSSSGAPSITGLPASPATNNAGDSRIFSITANQTVNVSWYLNGTLVQSNNSVTSAAYTNTSAIQGTWMVNATAANMNGSVSKEWTWIVNAPSSSGAPSITGLPASPATNNAGDSRTFSITTNQTVNVSWYLNGTLVQSNNSVTSAAYTNTSAKQGIWIVNATATNVNGSVSKEWTWNVGQISDGPSAHWKLDENTGTTASDSSGNANTGIIYGPVWTTGKYGSALRFDGLNDYVGIPNSASMAGYPQATIEAWVYLTSAPSARAPIYSETTSSSTFRRIMLYVLPSGKIELDFRNSNADPAGSVSAVISNTAIDLNKWYHVAGIFNSVTGVHQIYINGNIDINANIPTSALGTSSTKGIEIGHLQGTGTGYFNGIIDEVKIFNRPLNAGEIASEYSGIG